MRLRKRSKLLRTTRKSRRLESLEDRRLLAITALNLDGNNELVSFDVDRGGDTFTYTPNELVGVDLTAFAGSSDAVLLVGNGDAVPAAGNRASLIEDNSFETGVINPARSNSAMAFDFASPVVNAPGADIILFEFDNNDSDDAQIQINGNTLTQAFPTMNLASGINTDVYSLDAGTPGDIAALESGGTTQTSDTTQNVRGLEIDLSDYGVAAGGTVSSIQFGSAAAGDTVDPVFIAGLSSLSAVDDDYTTSNPITEDQTLTIPDGATDVLANDIGFPVTLNNFDGTSDNGATVNVDANGSFTYDPTGSTMIDALDEGEILVDTFNYTATDSAPVFTPGPLQVHVYDGTSSGIGTADAARGSNTVGDPVTPADNAGPDTIALADIGSAGDGSFTGQAPVPAPGGGDSYAVFLTGFISVDNSANPGGTWTFGNFTDDNSRIRIDLDQDGVLEGDLGAVNGETVAFQSGCCGVVLSPELTIPDGVYEYEFVYTEGGGGDYGEFFYAPGTPAFNTTNYSLFGDDSQGIATGTFELPGVAETDTATVSIQVTGVNDAPIANPDTNTIIEEANSVPAANTVTGNVLTNDTDIDDDNSSFTVTNDGIYAGTYGELVLNTNGSYTYTLDDSLPAVQALQTGGASLSENFSYDMSDNHDDGNVKSASSSLALTIRGANDAPVANDDPTSIPGTYQVDENGTLSIGPAEGVLVNDTDIDNGSLGLDSIDTTGTEGLVTADLDSGALGALQGEFLDLDDGTDLVGNRTSNSDLLFDPLDPFVANGVSDFVLQRFPITPTGDAAGVITPSSLLIFSHSTLS